MTEKKSKSKRKESFKDRFGVKSLTDAEVNDIANGIISNEIFTDRHLGNDNETTFGCVFMPLILMGEEDKKSLFKNPPAMVYAFMKDAMGSRSINGNPSFGSISFVWEQKDVEKIFDRVKEISKFMNPGVEIEASGNDQKIN